MDALVLTLSLLLTGGGGSPGLLAAPGGPAGEAADGAEGAKARGGGPLDFPGR